MVAAHAWKRWEKQQGNHCFGEVHPISNSAHFFSSPDASKCLKMPELSFLKVEVRLLTSTLQRKGSEVQRGPGTSLGSHSKTSSPPAVVTFLLHEGGGA